MSMRTIYFGQRVREKAVDYSLGSVELRLLDGAAIVLGIGGGFSG